jgi:hypothetical protein
MPLEPRPDEAPPLIEALAVWGWAVEHGGIPLEYAAAVLAEHPCYVEDPGAPTPAERRSWASEDLVGWEDAVVSMDWPGDDAFDRERWDQDAYWELRERVEQLLGVADSDETTDQLLHRYCQKRIAECERMSDEQHLTRPNDEGNER